MRARLPAFALLAGALAGCGSAPADVFDISRTGKDPNANVRLVVSDGGSVRCNNRKPVVLTPKRLLAARELARDLESQAALALELPPGSSAILTYRVRLEAGTIGFSDTSRGIPQTFNRVAAFTADVAEHVCKLER